MLIQLKQSGFTLVELVIVIAVLAILTTFAIPSYQQMIQNAMIKTATESILTGFQIARAEAVTRNTNVQFDFRGDKSDWTVCVSPAAGGSCPTTDGATTIQSRKKEGGSSSTITVAPTGGPYVFNGFGVMTSLATGTLNLNISNSASTSSRNLRIVVAAGGAIKSCDPALDSSGTDPRRC